MKAVIEYSNKNFKELIKEYGVRKVKRAFERAIWTGIGEWDMDACVKEELDNMEEEK